MTRAGPSTSSVRRGLSRRGARHVVLSQSPQWPAAAVAAQPGPPQLPVAGRQEFAQQVLLSHVPLLGRHR
eukprot:CAMPEP_0202749710 /NCGR_PEP_ID=MMETSP1388-20130828/10746_1 /ASSEMBLY_ACC=CAM_ASM_000864 /TAXON_ID=37098 /ORGANISM="Isochrysis sp, Strain CCMP1244" /LENGTH=69 /DNA_ID=CAMNT_0049417229 /DNA_START=14 /DNA_END=219 /DNA_ORIENTATION=-